MTLQRLRAQLRRYLKDYNVDSPESDSGLLLMHVLGLEKTRLLLDDSPVPEECVRQVMELARRRAAGEPVRYLTGVCPFLDMEFYVNSSTLIPRPETELLTEAVSGYLTEHPAAVSVWDVGCGSGCIGLSLARRHPAVRVTAMDISRKALETAAANARRWKLEAQVTFLLHDVMTGPPALPAPDVVVSNPPYIPTGQIAGLQREVRDYEPRAALDGGPDGLRFYRKMIADMPLAAGGLLAFEIGWDQGETVPALLRAGGYGRTELRRDLAGLPRAVLGYRDASPSPPPGFAGSSAVSSS